MDRDNTTRTGAKDPWGREAWPLAQRHAEARARLDSEPGTERRGGSGRRVDANQTTRRVCREQAPPLCRLGRRDLTGWP